MDQNIIVTESSRNLRALGRDALRGKWKLAVSGTLIYMLLMFVPMVVLNAIFSEGTTPAGVSTIYSFLISGPLALGYAMFTIAIFRRKETSPTEVFYGFERFWKSLGLYIVMLIFILLWMLLLIVPGIIAALRYSMAFYILADNPEMGIMQALDESKRMMKGNKWKYFCMNFSFIGWVFLATLPISIGSIFLAPHILEIGLAYYNAVIYILGIGYLWVTPYLEVTAIGFYDIANGSLRAVKEITDEAGEPVPAGASSIDPITVYKEEQEALNPAVFAEPESDMAEPVQEPEADRSESQTEGSTDTESTEESTDTESNEENNSL